VALADGARALADNTRPRRCTGCLPMTPTPPCSNSSLPAPHQLPVPLHNRGYASFDEFLADLTADKRKKLKRERRYVRDAGVTMEIHTGHDMTRELWDRYQRSMPATSCPRRDRQSHARVSLPARRHHAGVGGVMFARQDRVRRCRAQPALARCAVRRYWADAPTSTAALRDLLLHADRVLHREGLTRFEAARGEHKLARGFLPSATHSAHWLRHPQFARAVADFLRASAAGSSTIWTNSTICPFKSGMVIGRVGGNAKNAEAQSKRR